MSLIVDIEKKLGSFSLKCRFETDTGTMALLGASGSGKSVTLKCIAGIMTPDRGRIILDGKTLFDSEKRINLTPQERQVGYLFQQYALFPNMTVFQNILCGIHGRSREEKQRQALENIRRFQLTGLEKKYPPQLSGGQQQRVALARILASKPLAILLDEPFSALDSFLKWHLELEMANYLSDFNGPILWVSHDLGECYRNCRNVCVMENGLSSPVTDMETLARSPVTISSARLAGCRNFLTGQRTRDGIRIDGWNLLLSLPADCEKVTAAIPDHAVIIGSGEKNARVVRIIRDLEHSILLLESLEDPGAPLLRALQRDSLPCQTGQEVSVSLDHEYCHCYRMDS